MDKKEFTVSEVIDAIGISKHTWVVFVLLAFAMIFDGYDFMIVNSTNLLVVLARQCEPGRAHGLADHVGPVGHGARRCVRRHHVR